MLHSRAVVMYHPDNADNPDDGTVVCRPEPPRISARWTPEQTLRRDTAAGTFEHVNARDYSNDALYVQQALLYTPQEKRLFSWSGAAPVFALIFGALLAVAVWGAT
jgi:hypothetical protein